MSPCSALAFISLATDAQLVLLQACAGVDGEGPILACAPLLSPHKVSLLAKVKAAAQF